MKSIELTKNHKSKLLEMCKILFPELTDLEIRNSMEDFCFKFEHICIEYGRRNDNLVIIHWFEFCVTKLAPKILCQNKSIISSSYSKKYFLQNKIINSNEHIVNYLYGEFKKLK